MAGVKRRDKIRDAYRAAYRIKHDKAGWYVIIEGAILVWGPFKTKEEAIDKMLEEHAAWSDWFPW